MCECRCRHDMRWIHKLRKQYHRKTDTKFRTMPMIVELFMNTPDCKFDDLLIDNLSKTRARLLFDELECCYCCERHMSKRPTWYK